MSTERETPLLFQWFPSTERTYGADSLEAGNTLPATQQPASCCPVLLWHQPIGFVWRLLLQHPNQSSWGQRKNQPKANPMGRHNSTTRHHDATLQCVHTLISSLVPRLVNSESLEPWFFRDAGRPLHFHLLCLFAALTKVPLHGSTHCFYPQHRFCRCVCPSHINTFSGSTRAQNRLFSLKILGHPVAQVCSP